MKMASRVIKDPDQLIDLLEITFKNEDPVSSKAGWILDVVLREKLELLLPHLDYFCKHLGKAKLDGSIRSLAKICEMLVLECIKSKEPSQFAEVGDANLEAIATACFDWLISDQKVAPQAYSMTSLYYLGKKFSWIHDELRQLLEQNYGTGSAAYQARARMILKHLSK